MLRLRAFRPTNDKIVKIQLHPTHPWLVTSDASDHVSVWNWEHRQVIYELKAGGVDERRLVGVKLEKLAEGESEPKGKPTEAIRGGSMEFLSRSTAGDGPLVAFGGSDGVIRVLSMITWKLVRRYTGGHKGSISCLMTFIASSGEALLVSGGSDGLLVLWSAEHGQDSLVPKLSLKELRRIKPVPKLACHSVASWCHPRAPNLDILTCVKDSHIWAIEHPTYSALTRPLCELSSLVPPQFLASNKKLRVYSMVVHPLQPHLVATGTNIGVIVSEFDSRSLPPVAPLPTLPGSREHSAVYVVERELKLLSFQLSNTVNPSLGSNGSLTETGRIRGDSSEQLQVKQIKKHISTPVPHDSYSVLSMSSSGKYLAVVWPDIPYFSIYKVSDWSIVDSGSARLLAWDTCQDKFALLESAVAPRIPIIPKGGSSRKAKEAAAAAAQAAAAAASAASAATVQVRILLDDGTSNVLMRSIGGRNEPVIGLHGGALLGVAYRTSRRISPVAATAISTIQSMPLSGFGGSGLSSFTTIDDGYSSQKFLAEPAPQNFQLYSWETFQPVGGLLPQPEWTSWDQTVEYCAFAYQQYIVISSLRPQYRYLGDVAIPHATGAVWHRRQLFVATPTTIECVFVDAGLAAIDIETKRRKEELKLKEAQARAIAEHGELALIAVEGAQAVTNERIKLRPPMLQVVRLASFQHAPSVPPFLTLPKQSKVDGEDPTMPKEVEERKVHEIAVGGGGLAVAVTRFPAEQKRPVGPLVVVGVRDGVLWLIDRASRLGREHHDDLAQFMLGMGYATEALHLPGISKRLEFDLAMQSSDLKRALQCLLTMSNSRDIGHESTGLDLNDIMNLTAKKEHIVDAVEGVVKFTKEFMDLIDAADATAQAEIAREATKRLAAAASVKGALRGHELRGLALRLANHGELTRLSGLVNNLISVGFGREAAFAAAVLGDNALMEKAWQDTGMLAEAVLHAHAHGRPTLRSLVQSWNKMLQKEMEHTPSTKTDAAAAFLASLEEPKLTSLTEAGKKPPIEILPPGMPSLNAPMLAPKKPTPATQGSQQPPGKPLLLEGPTTSSPVSAAPASESSAPPSESTAAPVSEAGPTPTSESGAPPAPEESGATTPPETSPSAPVPLASSASVSSDLSEPSLDNQNPNLSTVSISDPVATGGSVPPPTSSQSATEAPSQLEGRKGPNTMNESWIIRVASVLDKQAREDVWWKES
ncbi:hypothetical protein RJ639_045355 [Escallonia herrerae]|uniref:Transducin/WD40 repeat-like superfamily protein n=1 Tax=Escallonia herrerae TaxID=1293975 RepID=A0AA88WGW5_9ASTE|nr:hypothetical protein RJ639_045355 [Escallonia herrerae]